MVDNVTITAGVGTTIAADDVGGAKHQRVKLEWGPDGTVNETDVATGKPLPVQVRSATGLIPVGEPTDAKSTATDTTSASLVSITKQISASTQSTDTSTSRILSSSTPVAPASATSTTSLNIGGRYDSTQKTLTNGQEASYAMSARGAAIVTPGVETFTVTASSKARSVATSVTRPNDATPYTAGDVVGATAAVITWANLFGGAGEYMITDAALEIDVAAIPAGMTSFNLYLYNVTVPSALADNAVFDIPVGDRASFLGKISLGGIVDEVSTLYIERNGINKVVKAAGTDLFGYLVTVGGFTPSAQAVKVITLHSLAL